MIGVRKAALVSLAVVGSLRFLLPSKGCSCFYTPRRNYTIVAIARS
jgi:hypothetical protein